MLDTTSASVELAEWLEETTEIILDQDALARLLSWAKDEFEKEDLLPAAVSQRFSFREKPPSHLAADFEGKLSFIPGVDWSPHSALLVFASTPDQFSTRLAQAHDYCIRHDATAVVVVTDYFDNQAFSRPGETLAAIRDRHRIGVAMLLHTVLGFHFFSLL